MRQTQTTRRRLRRRFPKGIALAWTAILLFVMIGIVGLSIDWGWIAVDAHWLQNAADAAALSGGLKLRRNDVGAAAAYQAARELALANYAAGGSVDVHYNAETNDSTLDVVLGRWYPSTRTFEPLDLNGAKSANAVRVVTRHVEGWHVNAALPLHFGPIFQVHRANIVREATAMSYGKGGSGLICLAPNGIGLSLGGGAKVAVYATDGELGEIYVNSEWSSTVGQKYAVEPGGGSPVTDEAILQNPVALARESNWAIYCDQLNVCGEANPAVVTGYDAGEIFTVLPNAPPMPDPLRGLPALSPLPADGYAVQVNPTTGEPVLDADGNYVPAAGFNPDNVTKSPKSGDAGVEIIGGLPTLTLAPGYYSGGFTMTSGNCRVRLLPGVYAVGGGKTNGDKSGLVVSGGIFEAEGCMLYVTKSKQNHYGRVTLNGSESNGAQITISEYKGGAGEPSGYQAYADAGMAIFQDRQNTNDAEFTGGSASTFAGTLYFHSNSYDTNVSLSGNCGNLGIQVITDRLEVKGGAFVTITYDGRNFEPADEVVLVK